MNSLKGVSTRRLRQRYCVCIHREHLWFPSYVAASASGAPWETLKAYIGQQRTPARPDQPRPERPAARGGPAGGQRLCRHGAACSFLAAAVVVGGRGLEGATPTAYAAGVAMAVVGTAVAIAASLAGLARVGSAWASIVSSFEPVFTVALGVAVLGDRLGPGKVAGGVAVVAGAVLVPLLGGAREPVGSPLHPEYSPTRGSTRR